MEFKGPSGSPVVFSLIITVGLYAVYRRTVNSWSFRMRKSVTKVVLRHCWHQSCLLVNNQ